MDPSAVLIRSAALWLLAALPIGVWVRSAFVWTYSPGPLIWANLIDAHSHTMYFGWAALGVMGLILRVLPGETGKPLAAPRATSLLLRLAPVAVGGALLSFAWQGYGPFSIAFSTLNEIIWYVFVYIFWQNVKDRPVREWSAALCFIGAAVVMLLVSTVGTYVEIITTVVMKLKDPVWTNSGVYLFLQAYSDGWMEVGLMGVITALLGGFPSRDAGAALAGRFMFFIPLTTLSLLVPFGLTGWLPIIGLGAGMGFLASQFMYIYGIAQLWDRVAPAARPWWGLAAAVLAVKALTELLPLLPNWAQLANDHQLLIAYLHLKLLLMFSAGMVGAFATIGKVGRGFWMFTLGASVMVGALAAHGFLADRMPAWAIPLMAVAFVSAIFAFGGIAHAIWPVAMNKASEG